MNILERMLWNIQTALGEDRLLYRTALKRFLSDITDERFKKLVSDVVDLTELDYLISMGLNYERQKVVYARLEEVGR